MGRANKRFYLTAIIGFSILTISFNACTQNSGPSATPGPPSPNRLLQTDDWIPSGTKSVLWVGAHPDDEIYVAPILAELCKNRKMTCNLLVMTDGGKGNCHLAGGCLPTVAAVRDIEMRNAAKYYNAILEKPNFADSSAGDPDGILVDWNNSIGGGNKLLDSLTSYIVKVNPDIILTFDPRHGSSCHLAHRAVGRLVMAATLKPKGNLASIFFPQAVWTNGLYSSTQVWAGNEIVIAADKKVFVADAAAQWQALIDNLTFHPSQFPAVKNDIIDAFHYAPTSTRISPLLHATDADMADPLYQNLCPFNDTHWPGR